MEFVVVILPPLSDASSGIKRLFRLNSSVFRVSILLRVIFAIFSVATVFLSHHNPTFIAFRQGNEYLAVIATENRNFFVLDVFVTVGARKKTK